MPNGRPIRQILTGCVILLSAALAPGQTTQPSPVDGKSVVEATMARYGDLATYRAELRRYVVDDAGERDPAVAIEKLTLSYRAPSQLSIISDDATVAADAEHAILILPRQKAYMRFVMAGELSTEMLAGLNRYMTHLRLYPVVDALTGHLMFPASAHEDELDGRAVVRLEYERPLRMDVYVNPQAGRLVQTRHLMSDTPEGRAWLLTEFAAEHFNPEFTGKEFSTAAPGDYSDMTTMAQANEPSARSRPARDRVGKPAPDFTYPTLGGEDARLSDTKGNVVVLDFWAMWCPPCIASLPHIEKAKQELKSEKVLFWGLNMDTGPDREAKLRSFMERHKVTTTQLLVDNQMVLGQYGVSAYPTFFFLDANGVVRDVHFGMISDPDLVVSKVRSLLRESAAN